MRKPEQRFWDYLDSAMGRLWLAQRHEDRYSTDIPDVSYSCGRHSGWIELKVIDHWPAPDRPLVLTADHFTPGQRQWLTRHGKAGAGHTYVFIRVLRGQLSDFVLIRWDQLHELGKATQDWWCFHASGYWQRTLDARSLAGVLSASLMRADER